MKGAIYIQIIIIIIIIIIIMSHCGNCEENLRLFWLSFRQPGMIIKQVKETPSYVLPHPIIAVATFLGWLKAVGVMSLWGHHLSSAPRWLRLCSLLNIYLESDSDVCVRAVLTCLAQLQLKNSASCKKDDLFC